MPGLVVVEISRGASLRVWLRRARKEARQTPIAALAALVAIGGFAGGAVLWSVDRASGATDPPPRPTPIAINVTISDDSQRVVVDRVTTLPHGCTATFEFRVVTDVADLAVVARLSPEAAPTYEEPSPAEPDDPIAYLRELARLRDDGILTDEEFDSLKRRLLELP